MGFLTRFVINHTKPDRPKPIFQDASSRTSFLKRNAIQKTAFNAPDKKNLVDINETNRRLSILRNSGGIPKKFNLNTS